MHSLSWLASNGTAAIVCFPGIMYRGGAEQKIRKYLVDNNYVDGIIQLPNNLFFGTSIATCIMVMKKNKADNKTLFIDATSECVKVTNNNKLTPENIDRIVDVFAKREEVEHFAHLASYEEVSGNDYNLSVSTYVEAEDTREKIDIVKLNAEIKEIFETTVIRWFDNSAKKWNRNALFDAVWNSDSMKISNAASEKTIGCYSTERTEQ